MAATVLVLGAGSGCGSAGSAGLDGSGGSATQSSPDAASRSPTPAPQEVPPAAQGAAPRSVSIPALDLEEDLDDLGITDTGVLEVPADPDRVGWFTGGGRPGGRGPTVIVGHVDSTTGPAVFARLPELGEGDVVRVEDRRGRVTAYEVASVRDVPQVPFPTEEVFGATSEDTLRMITCTGPYDDEAGRYTENRVVTAVSRG